MRELEVLFHKVRSVKASCQMNNEQVKDYDDLNKLYNKLSGSNVKHSICSKRNLLVKIETYIDAKGTKNN
tara:strand:- start:293 stop:502 length:210 start_codon:yes stop_codon:yes gene_type:complete